MVDIKIPPSEKGKLYPFVPSSLAVPIFVTFTVLMLLFLDIALETRTNPFMFYSIPFIFMIMTLTVSTVPVIRSTLGLGFRTLKEWIIILLSLPVGWFVGWGLVQLATNQIAIFRVATYPWVARTLATAGQLSILTPAENFFLYLTVAFFEEATAIFLGKNIANWFHLKGSRGMLASVGGYIVARLVLVTHHWFAYKGFSQPGLYLSATAFFMIFTVMAVVVGLIIHKFKTGEEFDELGFLPISMPIALIAHLAFDYTFSQLSVVSINTLAILLPLVPDTFSIILSSLPT